jgi:hypothetical protein
LESIFERDVPARIALHRQIAQVDRKLQRMIDLEADVAVVMRLSDEVEQLRAERNVRRTLMLVAMYKTLTLAQRARLFVIPRSSEPVVRYQMEQRVLTPGAANTEKVISNGG